MKMAANERTAGYPRLCAHRGFNMAAPENTLPAFALAVAMGAQEIEFDLWPDLDGELVVCHDPALNRTTNGQGLTTELTTDQIKTFDAGIRFSDSFRGTRVPLFEEVLDLLAGKVIMNIHIKSVKRAPTASPEMKARSLDLDRRHSAHGILMPPLTEGVENILDEVENRPWQPYDPAVFRKILDTLDKYHCRDYAYIAGTKDVLTTARELAPDLPRCCLEGHMNYSIVEHAIEYGCRKVQFCKGLTTKAMIDHAKEAGLICNLFWADDPDEAAAYFALGIDCVLTNNFGPVYAGTLAR